MKNLSDIIYGWSIGSMLAGMVSDEPGVTALPDCRGRSLGERERERWWRWHGPLPLCTAHSLVKEREGERERKERASALCFKLHSLGSSLNSSGGSSIAASLSVRQKTEAALWWFAIRAPLSLPQCNCNLLRLRSGGRIHSTVDRDFLW